MYATSRFGVRFAELLIRSIHTHLALPVEVMLPRRSRPAVSWYAETAGR